MDNEICIAWQNLCYEATVSRRLFPASSSRPSKKPLLQRLYGTARLHQLTALMGPSGAGKTSLLKCLSSASHSGASITPGAALLINSRFYRREQKWNLCYIEQHVHECIEARLTVRQIFRYAFQFKNGLRFKVTENGVSKESSMNEHILGVMRQLMLHESILDQRFDQCSGGEQKRIAVGQELMATYQQHQARAPSLLIVDEPTTGLDSASAHQLIRCFRSLASSHAMAIIASLHAPSDDTLTLFDKLYVLAKGGVCIYSGHPAALRSTLEQNSSSVRILPRQPPIEALIKLACGSGGSAGELATDETVVRLANVVSHQEGSSIEAARRVGELVQVPFSTSRTLKSFSLADTLLHFCRLLYINFIARWRTQAASILLYIAIYVIFATIFNRDMAIADSCYPLRGQKGGVGDSADDLESNKTVLDRESCRAQIDEEVQYRENISFINYSIFMTGFVFILSSTMVFTANMKIFRHEHRNNWYSTGVFYLSTSLVTLAEVSLFALLVAVLSYFLSGQHAADDYTLNWTRFRLYLLFIWLYAVYMQSWGQLIGALLANTTEMALVTSAMCYAQIGMQNGLLVDTEANTAIDAVSSVVSLKFVTKGILHALYAIDRCDLTVEQSFVLEFHHTNRHSVTNYIIYLAVNMLAVRMATFVCIFLKHSSLSASVGQLFSQDGSKILSSSESEKPAQLEQTFSGTNHVYENNNSKLVLMVEKDKLSRIPSPLQHRIAIVWQHLTMYKSSSLLEQPNSATEQQPDQSSTVLSNLHGFFRFGTLNALMGTSGAGKTSLLKTLNGRCKARLSPQSNFYLSNLVPISTCYITQEVSGHLITGLTVRQMVLYASKLKNGDCSQAEVDHESIVHSLLDELCLADAAHTKVERCSGGERKRLVLALELTAQHRRPNLICIDEPTSGLDSNSALIMIKTLHKLVASHDIAIVASIHQPNTEILMLFDQLYVLARGGVCIYSGRPDQIECRLKLLVASDEHSEPSNGSIEYHYPIETLIKYSCLGADNSLVKELVHHELQQHYWQLRQTMNQTTTSKTDWTVNFPELRPVPDGVASNRCRFSLNSAKILLLRQLATIRAVLWIQYVAYWAFLLMYGAALPLFYNMAMIPLDGCVSFDDDPVVSTSHACSRTDEDKVQESLLLVQNAKYAYFFMVVYLLPVMAQSSLEFYRNFGVFLNEHRNGWYSTGSFYLTTSLCEIVPMFAINAAYVYLVNYYSPVQPHISTTWHLYAILCLGSIAMQGMAHCFTILCRGQLLIQILLSIIVFLILSLFGNLFMPYHRLHYAYQALSQFSIARHTYEATMLVIYGFGRCASREVQTVLYALRLSDDYFATAYILLGANLVLYRVAALWLLVRAANPRQNHRVRVARISNYLSGIEK